MDIIEILLKEFDYEANVTRKMLERVPAEKFSWKPHARSMDLKTLTPISAEGRKGSLGSYYACSDYTSIRGVFGGVGLTIFCALAYLAMKDFQKGLRLLILLWGFYALSRLITWMAEGPLGDFGNTWLVIESLFFFIAVILAVVSGRKQGIVGSR